MSGTSGVAEQPMFLSDEVFALLVRKVPAAVLEEVPATLFSEAIGTTRERFEEIVTALGANGRTQGLVGRETTGYLRQALGMAILECSRAEFAGRFGVELEDALVLMQQISARLGVDGEAAEKQVLRSENDNQKSNSEQQVPDSGNDNQKSNSEQQVPRSGNDNQKSEGEQQVPSHSAALRANDNQKSEGEQQVPRSGSGNGRGTGTSGADGAADGGRVCR